MTQDIRESAQNAGSQEGLISRRRMIRAAVGVAAMGGLAALGACASPSSSRSRVGEPIPPDPSIERVPRQRLARRPSDVLEPLPRGVIPRTRWAAWGPNPARADRMGRIERITVHHDGMTAFADRAEVAAAARLEAIRGAHVSRQWADIGYHYAIDPAGRVWQGRPLVLQGAHVKDHNPGNIGIVVLGNFEEQRPSPQTTRALDALIASEMRRHRVRLASVHTHQELAPTACPGRYLQVHMERTRARGGDLVTMV